MGKALVAGLLASVLAGCYADFPIDADPQTPVDPSVLGTWWCPRYPAMCSICGCLETSY
jgi:hypothetical protein